MATRNVASALSGAVTARGALGRTRAACEDWPRLHPLEGRQHMSTDTEVDPVEQWEDLADNEMDELIRVFRAVARMKDTDPTFHAFMIGSIAAHIQRTTKDLQTLLDAHGKEAIRRDLSLNPPMGDAFRA